MPIATYYYVSSDAPENIIAFYKRMGSCEGDARSELCRGHATPTGEYFVYVDLTSFATQKETSYAIEIQWIGCTYNIK